MERLQLSNSKVEEGTVSRLHFEKDFPFKHLSSRDFQIGYIGIFVRVREQERRPCRHCVGRLLIIVPENPTYLHIAIIRTPFLH